MNIRSYLTIAAATLAPMIFAQTANTSDAQWCQIIEQTLTDQGLNSEVRCDYVGQQKTLHVGIDGKVKTYPVGKIRQEKQDYSSTVYVICDELRYEFPHMRRGFDPQRRGVQTGRTWRAYSSSMPDEVYQDPRDIDALEVALQEAMGKAIRVQLIDDRYADNLVNQEEGPDVLLLKTHVLDCQRGERFEKPKDNAQNASRREPLKVDRTYAYLEVNIQLVNHRTGEILWQKKIDRNNDTFSVKFSDPMENCIEYVSGEVTRALNDLYPNQAPRPAICGNILKADEVKKDKAKTVYINLGTAQELKKNERLKAYRVFEVAGKTGEEEIGTIQVDKIYGEELALCDVKKGEREILSALEAGETIVIRN